MTAATGRARLARVELPDFGVPEREPQIPAAVYAGRLARLRELADARGYDRLVLYADREHSAGNFLVVVDKADAVSEVTRMLG